MPVTSISHAIFTLMPWAEVRGNVFRAAEMRLPGSSRWLTREIRRFPALSDYRPASKLGQHTRTISRPVNGDLRETIWANLGVTCACPNGIVKCSIRQVDAPTPYSPHTRDNSGKIYA